MLAGKKGVMMKKRCSNIELLRIFAMLMIVVYHIWYHCVNVQLTSGGNDYFNVPIFFKKLLILETVAPMGQVGNVIFIIISGYFMVAKEREIDVAGISKKLLFQQGFASVVLTIASALVFRIKKGIFINLIDINIFNQMFWYVGYYFAVVVFAKLFLNKYISRLSKKQYAKFLWVMFAIIQFSWIGGVLNSLASGILILGTGIFLYALGGYIYKYNPFAFLKTRSIIIIFFIVYILIYISFYNATETNIQVFYTNGDNELFKQNVLCFADNYFVPIILGNLIFELFRRIQISNSRFINYLGTSTFMVYLIHDNSFFYSLWNTQNWINILYNYPFRFILKLVSWTLMTFVIGVLVYSVYVFIEKSVKKLWCNKHE